MRPPGTKVGRIATEARRPPPAVSRATTEVTQPGLQIGGALAARGAGEPNVTLAAAGNPRPIDLARPA
jgi:hypothetical protein